MNGPVRALSARLRRLGLGALLLVMALAFQGSRGIWEPDEGFYTNVTLGMMDSGDWIVPRLNGDPFLDKPPLTYWGMAGGLSLLGRSEWGARAFHAAMFLVAALAVGAAAAACMLAAYVRTLPEDATGNRVSAGHERHIERDLREAGMQCRSRPLVPDEVMILCRPCVPRAAGSLAPPVASNAG